MSNPLNSGGFLAGTEIKGYNNPRSRNGGFPSNPVPIITRLAPDSVTKNPKASGLIGLKRFLPITEVFYADPVPVAVPKPFRTAPTLPPAGKTSKGLGGIIKGAQDAINLHPSILPSNPMAAFNLIADAKQTVNPVVNNRPTLRNALSRVTGFVGSAKNTVATTAQNRSPM